MVMAGLTALVVLSISPATSVTGGVLVKVLSLGRMALLILVATVLLRLRGLRWRDVGLSKPKPLRFFLAVVLGFGLALLFVAAAQLALKAGGLHAAPDYSMFTPLHGNLPLYLFFLIPVTWGTAAFGEEMLFRGFFLDAIRRLLVVEGRPATALAIIVQAALFGTLHLYQGQAGAVTAGAIGLAFGVAWWIAGRNLWAAIMLHGAFDSMAMTAAYLGLLSHHH
jgi:membrane protease YdiL (CAAX protease family)